MFIKSIEINNFKNIQNRTLYFDERTEIPANNGWGKSNTIDAILWVLTDRLRNASADIKSIKSKLDPLETSQKAKVVRVKLDTDCGVFEKTYQEIWKRPRGSETETLESHETTYLVNGEKKKAKDYEIELALRFKMPVQFIPILMVANYFGVTLDYKDRRQIIKDLVPQVTFDDVVQVYPQVDKLRDLFAIEPRIDVLLKQNKSKLQELRIKEASYATEIKLLESQIITPTEIEEKKLLQDQQLELTHRLAAVKQKITVPSKSASPEQLQATLSQLRLDHAIWTSIKTNAKVNSIKCVACGYEHQVDALLSNITTKGVDIKRALAGGTVDTKPSLVDIALRDQLTADLVAIEGKLSRIYTSQAASNNIVTKRKEEGENKVELMRYEQQGDLLNIYLKKWVELFGEVSNRQFEKAGITLRLFDYTLEGGIIEKCDILDNGVPYEKTNTASQIKLGIKLIDVLKEMKGYQDMPILIDNAEAILDKDFTTNSQLIMFSVGKDN